jgi:general secretion pathway protein B
MSYILDALKRADIERERGATPGLHTRHQPPSGLPSNPGVTKRSVTIGLLSGLVLAALVTGVWIWRTTQITPATATLPPNAVAAASTPTAQAPVTTQPAVTPPISLIASVPIASVQIAPVTIAPVTKAPVLTPPLSMAEKVAPPPATQVSALAVTHINAVAAKSASVVLLFDDLPQDIRSQIPKITITGTVDADSPNQQLLLVNNLVLSQGNLVAPEVKLEEIQTSSSVFSFRGTRFRIPH